MPFANREIYIIIMNYFCVLSFLQIPEPKSRCCGLGGGLGYYVIHRLPLDAIGFLVDHGEKESQNESSMRTQKTEDNPQDNRKLKRLSHAASKMCLILPLSTEETDCGLPSVRCCIDIMFTIRNSTLRSRQRSDYDGQVWHN